MPRKLNLRRRVDIVGVILILLVMGLCAFIVIRDLRRGDMRSAQATAQFYANMARITANTDIDSVDKDVLRMGLLRRTDNLTHAQAEYRVAWDALRLKEIPTQADYEAVQLTLTALEVALMEYWKAYWEYQLR